MSCNVWEQRRLVVTMPSRSLTEIAPLGELCGLVGLCVFLLPGSGRSAVPEVQMKTKLQEPELGEKSGLV